ncbi:MAG: response regulator [Lachnospiraceae bacterium]|nr:response regulator [Lachnospiraceae bacterium]
MDKKVILIGDTKRFMVNAIIKGLTEEGFLVESLYPSLEAVSEHVSECKVYVMYLEDDIDSKFMVYMRDYIADHELQFYLIGNQGELDEAQSHLKGIMVADTFLRPLNVKALAERLEKGVAAEEKRMEQKKILVVDDDGTMLRTIKSWLDGKYRVYIVNSGMNAITFLAKNQVDLILLDYEMPVTSGPQVLEMLRSEEGTRDIPVMFLTAKGDKESVMKVLALKPEKYLLKTMQPGELIENIDAFFASKK